MALSRVVHRPERRPDNGTGADDRGRAEEQAELEAKEKREVYCIAISGTCCQYLEALFAKSLEKGGL